jgi:hypothetical protein
MAKCLETNTPIVMGVDYVYGFMLFDMFTENCPR